MGDSANSLLLHLGFLHRHGLCAFSTPNRGNKCVLQLTKERNRSFNLFLDGIILRETLPIILLKKNKRKYFENYYQICLVVLSLYLWGLFRFLGLFDTNFTFLYFLRIFGANTVLSN